MHAKLLTKPTPRTAQNQNTNPGVALCPGYCTLWICTLLQLPDRPVAQPAEAKSISGSNSCQAG